MKVFSIVLAFTLCFVSKKVLPATPYFECEIISYTTKCAIKNGKLTYTVDVSLQINAREGEEYGYVSVPYSKGNKLNSLDAWLSDVNGKVIKRLKKTDIGTSSAVSNAALYEDDFVKTFHLKHNQYPYQVHYSYSSTYLQYINIADWYPTFYNLPSRKASLIFEVPHDFKFYQHERNVSQASVTDYEDYRSYTWESSYEGNIGAEHLAPAIRNFLPNVKLVPENFVFGIPGKLGSWEALGTWQYQTNEGLRELPDEEKKNIDRLLAGAPSDREKVRRLYHYLQDQTRYILVIEGIGGLKPYPAEYVARNKFGDCKALSNYMIAALAYAGIKGYYTKIFAGEEIAPLIRDLPSQQFNHVIVSVPLKEDTVWLECTNKNIPFGYLGTFTQNREALLVDNTGSRLVRTPALGVDNVLEKRVTTAEVAENGKTRLSIHYTFRGDSFEDFSTILKEYKRNEQEEIIRRIIPYPEFTLQDWKLTKVDRDADYITLDIELLTDSFLKKYGNEYVVSFIPLDVPKLELPAKRKLPLELPYPIHQQDSLVIKLPSSIKLVRLPKQNAIESEEGVYAMESSQNGGEVTIRRTFILYGKQYDKAGYETFFSHVSSVRNLESSNALIVKKE